ncbi:MAG: c-type cytochrome [Saprospiraceae bacterium]|nr:c-type cytochrome [Saprospiraceae bacterium]
MKFAKYIFTFLLLGLAATMWGQAAEPAAAAASEDQFSQIMVYILAIGGALLFIVAMIYVIKVNQFLYKRVLDLEAAKSGAKLPAEALAALAAQDSFWTTLRKKYWEDPVPLDKEEDILFHHDFDGIRELDNRLPPWWVNMFIITIIWAVGYMYYYHWGGDGPSSLEEYTTEMEQAKKEQAIALAGAANAVDESNATALTDGAALGEGELIYKNSCAVCHGPSGEGTVGPNMTDEYWIHGGGIKNVFKTIKYGVPDKGMVAWQKTLSPSDILKVGSYILTLQGTNPPNPKAPQGSIWKEEAAAASPDTTAIPPK